MTREPRRWLDEDSELNALERRILRGGAQPKVPPVAKAAIWGALSERLAVAGTAAASSQRLWLLLLKNVGLGALVGGVAIGVVTGAKMLSTTNEAKSRVAVSIAQSPVPQASDPAVNDTAPPASATPRPAESNRRGASKPESAVVTEPPANAPPAVASAAFALTDASDGVAQMEREALAVARARSELRAGHPADALGRLQQLDRAVGHGLLLQEREALAIEALQRLGHSAEASQRARAFLERYPASPHAESVRRALAR